MKTTHERIRLDTPQLEIPPDRRALWRSPGRVLKGDWARLVLRFIAKIEVVPDGCWLWRGFVHANAAGSFQINHHLYGAHRIAYRLFIGPIPPDMDVLHTCETRHCVKPHHLRLGNATAEAMAKYGPPRFRVSAADLAIIEARDVPQP